MAALFSQRYFRALEQNVLQVEIPEPARRKLWSWLDANNPSIGVQRDPNDRWIFNSSVLEETEMDLMVERGWRGVPGAPTPSQDDPYARLRHLFYHGGGHFVLRCAPKTGQVAKRESLLGMAVWLEVRRGEYTQEAQC